VALDGLMNEIFGPTERITTISRREILREQVFESLFQDKTDTNRKAELSKQLNELFAGKSKITVNKQISFVDFDNDSSFSSLFSIDNEISSFFGISSSFWILYDSLI